MENFSAFKLFYNDFLYRNNVMIEYDKINKYLNRIIDILKVATNLYHDDTQLYVSNLTKYQSKIKKELDSIMETYPYFFEKYYELYTRYVVSNNTVSDMPFVISCSFYNDYGIDNIKDDYVQRISSLEKKRLRDRAKRMSFIEYYKELLKDFNVVAYDNLISLLDRIINVDIDIRLSFDDNIYKYTKDIKKTIEANKRVIEKAKLSDDYYTIRDKMELVYKGSFKDFESTFEHEINNYLLTIYENRKKNNNDFFDSIVTNDLGYGIYKDFVTKELKYKEKYDRIFKSKKIVSPSKIAIAPSIRDSLLRIYYDKRFYFDGTKDINKLIETINGLKSLAWDLEDVLWNYIIFNSTHTEYLRRDNNVRYAIIKKLYELYNPYELLDSYDKTRNEVLLFIHSNSEILDELDIKYNEYKDIVSREDILNSIYNRRIEFIIDNAIDNISSKTIDYDTREYDLYYIAQGLSIDDILKIYKELNSLNKIDRKNLIEYIAQCILLIKNPTYSLTNIDYEMISDISRAYLGLEYEVELDSDLYINKREQFNFLYDEYLKESEFSKLKKEYKI